MKKIRTLLISAGPTCEPIDAVRYLSNFSTGTMGYCLAQAARRQRYRVVIVAGPMEGPMPSGVRWIRVQTTRQMQAALQRWFKRCDALIMAAAVCDWRPAHTLNGKRSASGRTWTLRLVRNPDIVSALAERRRGHQRIVGFALEDRDVSERAALKLRRKGLDLVVGNSTGGARSPFGSGTTDAWLLDRGGTVARLRRAPKERVARAILRWLDESWKRMV